MRVRALRVEEDCRTRRGFAEKVAGIASYGKQNTDQAQKRGMAQGAYGRDEVHLCIQTQFAQGNVDTA